MSILSKLQALLTAANTKTGQSDTTLTDAMQTLVDGYGQGGSYDLFEHMMTDTVIRSDYATALDSKNFLKSAETIFLSNVTGATSQYSAQTLFNNLPALKTIVLPKVTRVCADMIISNSLLEKIDLGNVSTIDMQSIRTNARLTVIILRRNGVASLANVNAFTDTPFESSGTGGTLYVPQDLISSYQAANNWSTILGYTNNSIQAIEGSIYETQYADGTPIS